jgi:hypothetical protein
VVRQLGVLGAFYKFDLARKGGNPCKIFNLHFRYAEAGRRGGRPRTIGGHSFTNYINPRCVSFLITPLSLDTQFNHCEVQDGGG